MQIKYLPMPITFDEKREWNARGYRVVDIRFAPHDGVEQEQEAAPAKRGRKPKAEQAAEPEAE